MKNILLIFAFIATLSSCKKKTDEIVRPSTTKYISTKGWEIEFNSNIETASSFKLPKSGLGGGYPVSYDNNKHAYVGIVTTTTTISHIIMTAIPNKDIRSEMNYQIEN